MEWLISDYEIRCFSPFYKVGLRRSQTKSRNLKRSPLNRRNCDGQVSPFLNKKELTDELIMTIIFIAALLKFVTHLDHLVIF